MHGTGWRERLSAARPHATPRFNNHLTPLDKALGFVHGRLCDARRLAHVAYFRRDPLLPELLNVRRVPSASALWRFGLEQLPSRKDGYTLDLDSTRLLHEDGNQEGVKAGYPRHGIKPCLHPLLALVAEVRLVAQLPPDPHPPPCGRASAGRRQ